MNAFVLMKGESDEKKRFGQEEYYCCLVKF